MALIRYLKGLSVDGNVGIGTNSPSFGTGGGLQISNAAQANLRFTDTSNATFITDLALSNENFYLINRSASGSLKFRVNGSNEALTILSSGNVGIGTTSPNSSVKLQVEETGSNAYIRIVETGNTGLDVGQETNGNGIINLRDNKDLRLFTNGTEAVRIKNAGNVGIGTTSPQSNLKLDVRSGGSAGDGAIAGYGYNGVGGYGVLGHAYAVDNLHAGSATGIRGISNGGRTVAGSVNIGGYFTATGSENNYALITDAGNVGIGIASPSEKLHVSGNLRVTGAFADSSASVGSAGTVLSSTNTGTAWVGASGLPGGPYLPLAGGTLTGNLNIQYDGGTSPVGLVIHNTSTNAAADAKIEFETQGAMDYSIGIDRSDSNKFKISRHANLESNNVLAFDSSSNATFAGDVTTNGDIIIDNSSGDPFLKLKTSAQDYVLRIDQSDSEKFQIRNTTSSVTALSIDASSNATFAGNVGLGNGTNIATFDTTANQLKLTNSYSGGASGMAFYSSNNTWMSTFYATTADYGYLDGEYAQWNLRKAKAGGLYLNNNSTYFVQPEGTSNMNAATFTGTVTSPTFLGDLNGTINTVTTAVTKANATNDTTVATTAFVQNLIGTIPAGLVFQGTWNAATNTPTLTSGSGTTGNFYIVSTSGSTNLDGVTDWVTGDWAVFIEQGGTDAWEKIDNSSVLDGAGTGQTLPLWSGSGTSNTLTDSIITQNTAGTNVGIGTAAPNEKLTVAGNIHAYAASGINAGFFASTAAGATSIAIRSSGVTHFNSGNVGIGITTPSAKLEVKTAYTDAYTPAAFNDKSQIKINTAAVEDNYAGIQFTHTGSTEGFLGFVRPNATGNVADFVFQGYNGASTSYEEWLRITNSGNVGIGTTAPAAKLQVSGSVQLDVMPTNESEGSIKIGRYDANTSRYNLVKNFVSATAASNYMRFAVHNGTENATVDVMSLNGAGNVGIGTTAPASRLHVVGDATANTGEILAEFRNSNNDGRIDIRDEDAGNSRPPGIHSPTAGYGLGLYASAANAPVIFYAGGIGSERMRISGVDGNVGIGTTAPSEKLEISGNSITRSKTIGLGTNYATSEGWEAAAASQFSSRVGYFGGNFTNNGPSAENKVEYDIGPFGSRELVWMSVPETGNNDDGGWNKSMDGFNNSANNGFMSIVYVRRDSGTASGNFYHGCSGSSTLNLDGTSNTNPYFNAFGINGLPADVWCVSIGIIHATNDTTTTTSALGGIYRLDSGEKITAATTYRQSSSNTTQSQRVYHYYSTSPSAQLDFSNPGFYILDGSEPSLGELLGSGSADDVFWSASGNNIYNDNTGNVGIGTTGPTAKLQVAGTTTYNSDAAQALRVCDAADISKGIHIGFDTTLDKGIIQSGDFGVVYKDLLLNPNAGNVGIGTSNINFSNGGGLVIGSGGATRLKIANATTGYGATDGLELVQSGVDSYIYNYEAGPMYFGTNNSTKLTLESGGNFGIGTTNPQSKLQVDGGIQMADDSATAAATKVGTMRYRTGTEYVEVDGVELVTNGDFATDTDWTKETGWTITGGELVATAATGATATYQSPGLTSGSIYKCTFTISEYTNGQVAFRAGTAASSTFYSAVGTYSVIMTAGGALQARFGLLGNSSTLKISQCSIVEVTAEDASYADMCMQTGSSTYEWVNIVRNTY